MLPYFLLFAAFSGTTVHVRTMTLQLSSSFFSLPCPLPSQGSSAPPEFPLCSLLQQNWGVGCSPASEVFKFGSRLSSVQAARCLPCQSCCVSHPYLGHQRASQSLGRSLDPSRTHYRKCSDFPNVIWKISEPVRFHENISFNYIHPRGLPLCELFYKLQTEKNQEGKECRFNSIGQFHCQLTPDCFLGKKPLWGKVTSARREKLGCRDLGV